MKLTDGVRFAGTGLSVGEKCCNAAALCEGDKISDKLIVDFLSSGLRVEDSVYAIIGRLANAVRAVSSCTIARLIRIPLIQVVLLDDCTDHECPQTQLHRAASFSGTQHMGSLQQPHPLTLAGFAHL